MVRKFSVPLAGTTFKVGTKIKLSKEDLYDLMAGLEDPANSEALLVASNEGYRIIPLKPDVKKLYIEVTTRCNFECITCKKFMAGRFKPHEQGNF